LRRVAGGEREERKEGKTNKIKPPVGIQNDFVVLRCARRASSASAGLERDSGGIFCLYTT
jgi:hypothetical protein